MVRESDDDRMRSSRANLRDDRIPTQGLPRRPVLTPAMVTFFLMTVLPAQVPRMVSRSPVLAAPAAAWSAE